MKKQLILLLLLPTIYSCIPQAFPIPQMILAEINFGGLPAGADKVEITITDPNCTNPSLCKPTSLRIIAGANNTTQVSPGNKIVNIRVYKNGQLISETTRNTNTQINQKNSINISELVISPSPSFLPSVTPTTTATISPTQSPMMTATPTLIPTASPTVTITPSSTPTATPTFSSGGSGGGTNGTGNTITPTIQVSATVNPDNTGVK